MLLMSTLGTRKKASILKGQANWNSFGESALRQKEIILKNNGTISALGHSLSIWEENFNVPCIYLCHIFQNTLPFDLYDLYRLSF